MLQGQIQVWVDQAHLIDQKQALVMAARSSLPRTWGRAIT